MKGYTEMIIEDTGCTLSEAPIVADLMRKHVFHSTLDWQSRSELRKGAREAYRLFLDDREFFEAHYRSVRELLLESKSKESAPV
jgi:hypothetical protein